MHTSGSVEVTGEVDRGRYALPAALLALAGLAWAATVVLATSPAAMTMLPGQTSPGAAALFAALWLTMMVAMMFPAITPVALLFRTVQRRRGAQGAQAVPTGLFVGGYLAVWTAAGVGADLVYVGAQALGTRVTAGPSLVPYLGGTIVVLAGIYQLTPLKNACLAHCRSPLHLVMHGWREGRWGAVRMGATHGLFCLGCCWAIMAVLFVVGLMNLGWMLALSLLILAEKVAPRGVAIGRVVGALFLALGVLMALQPRVFPAAGLVPAGAMPSMSSQQGQPASQTTYRAKAGSYSVTLTIGPATGGGHGRAVQGVPRRLELHVTDAMGMALVGARVRIRLARAGVSTGGSRSVALSNGRGGAKDTAYSATIDLEPGLYMAAASVNGHTAAWRLRLR